MIPRFLSRISALRGLRADFAALGFGALSAAALPPVHAIPVLLISVPGLLALIDGARGQQRPGRRCCCWPAVAARRGWWFGLGLHIIGLYWITEAILFEADRVWWLVPLAVPATAAALAVFIAAACAVARLARFGWPRVFALAGAWVLADLARQFVLTGFPWNLWGSVWEIPGSIGDVFIQPAALVGAGTGLTLATVLLGAATSPILGWRWRIGGGAVFFTAWSRVRHPPPATADAAIRTTVRGPSYRDNIAQDAKFDQAVIMQNFRHLPGLLMAQGRAKAGNNCSVGGLARDRVPALPGPRPRGAATDRAGG